ncbi:anti-sigma factor domain-containing protein [Nocardioides sp. SR21]|uniref:anti-sigma factor n=1 Tax=Nocardioides sp. SR21 TaxID=2919501 RepID=UPI001FAAFF7E|nr:anti-sigma factor [Nocardioides sp. SR21]
MTDVHALSGAYAVDALDDIERAAFERHLAACAECRAEVASLRETAALLAATEAVEPPTSLRGRVLAEISTVRPLPPEVAPQQPRRWLGTLVAAAAAVVVLLGAGLAVWHQPWEENPTVAESVLSADDAQSTTLELGEATATMTRSDSLGRAVIVTDDMPPPPEGKVYQLWFDVPGEGMVSAGVMPIATDQTVVLDGDATAATGAGITVEPTGGSKEPTTAPVALFPFDA